MTSAFSYISVVLICVFANADLWGRIVTLEVDRKGLQKVEKECIDTLVPLTPPKDTSRKYKQREMELKLRTELPLKFLVAVFLKQNGSMPMRKICHWLR